MIITQNLTDLIHQPAQPGHEILHKHLLVFCNISAGLSRYFADNRAKLAAYPARCNISAGLSSYFADNRANLAHYNKKLTRPVAVWLAHSYTYMRNLAFIIFFGLSTASLADDIDSKYKNIILKFAEAAFTEYMHLEPDSYKNGEKFLAAIKENKVTVVSGRDRIGRTVFVVLYPNGQGSLYVSMIKDKDGILEIYGRGGIPAAPNDFVNDFAGSLYQVISYPDDI